MNARTARIAPLLFLSGFCSLVYQVVWLKELRLVFGSSTPASAVVLAVFMGGLGLGSLILGRRAERSLHPLRFYAHLELGIAVSAMTTPFLLDATRSLYIGLGGTLALGHGPGALVRILLSALVLLPPTFLMGGTLPAAARANESKGDARRSLTAVLYGVNTLGAVTGAALTTFVLLEVFGVRTTLWLFCLLNLVVGVLGRAIDRTLRYEFDDAPPSEAKKDSGGAEKSPEPETSSGTRTFVLVAAAAVGFAFLLMELVWYRMLAPLLGGSTYTFGLILAIALLGIGLGALFYTVGREGQAVSLRTFAFVCGLEAVAIALPFALGDRIALLTLWMRDFGQIGLLGHVMAWSIITTIVAGPASFIAGYQFPMLIALLGRGRRGVARQVGQAYAANTGGAILGSLAGGFFLVPGLGALGSWKLVVVVLVVLGLAALASDRSWRESPRRLVLPLSTFALGLAYVFLALGPTSFWRHAPIGAGRAEKQFRANTRNGLRAAIADQRQSITWERDGRESAVAMSTSDGVSFIVNGKADGSAILDAGTQVMAGMLGGLLHEEVHSVLVIGLGTGSSAGWLASIPSVERVDVVELEPAILEVARACAPVNQDAMDNPKIHITIADAREFLLTTRSKYDLIFSEPSNPYRAGIASLFTDEFYEAAKKQLNPGGLFLQWVQGYEIGSTAIRSIFTTLAEVFVAVDAWQTMPGDLLLISREEAIPFDVPTLRTRVKTEPFKSALHAAWRADSAEAVFAHFVAGPSLARAVHDLDAPLWVNRDDLNMLEYAFARDVGRPGSFSINGLRVVAKKRGEHRPRITGGEIDWGLVDEHLLALNMIGGGTRFSPTVELDSEMRLRMLAMRSWVSRQPGRALLAWKRQTQAPRTPFEIMMMAHSHAVAGDVEEAEALIKVLAETSRVESSILEAVLAEKLNKPDEAVALLQKAFVAHRDDPWPSPMLLRYGFDLTQKLVQSNADHADALFEALEQPFSVRSADASRKSFLLFISMASEDPSLCLRALAHYGRWTPWKLPFLRARADCYARNQHPDLLHAQEELGEYLADGATPFGQGLVEKPHDASADAPSVKPLEKDTP